MPTYTFQQRIFMYDSYVITSSCREVVRRFQANYPGLRVPSREAIRLLVNKFRETGSILDKKRNVKQCVLTEQKRMRVNANFLRRCRICIGVKGQHFQHLL